jgi:serine/threonine-protein kinase
LTVVDSATEAPKSGVILAGKYRLMSLLGRGGMGSVWRAEHLSLQAPVAVKMIDPSIAQVPEALARFHREAQSAASLRSPNVVQILDHGVDPQTKAPFIVMELMEGESLAERLERVGRLPPKEASRIITQMARALTRAHADGIVHRDLKPDNVFLVKNEDEEVAKILDFGIAKSDVHRVGAATATGTVMGTAYYMSPEQISGSKEVDHRTDLWAVGVITHECITGSKPFESETLGGMVLKICTEPIRTPSIISGVPLGFDQWFQRSVMRDPAQRFQSARELADSLKALCESASVVGVATAQPGLGSSKTEWLDTGRMGLAQSGEVRPQTGGALSRTDSPHTTSTTIPTRSVGPWIFASVGLLAVVGGAIAFFTLSSSSGEAIDPATAASSLAEPSVTAAATVSDPPATPTELVPVVTPRVTAIPDAGAKAEATQASLAPAAKPPQRAAKRPRSSPPARPAPPPARPPPASPKPKPSPFDGLLKSRK